MNRLRILLLAPDANPEGVCGPLIAYSQAQALARIHDVTIVVKYSGEEVLRREQGAIRAVEAIRQSRADRIQAWVIRHIFKNNYYNQLLQFFSFPFSIFWELQAWRQLQTRIMGGEFDVVLRLLPVTTVRPSPFAYFLRHSAVPFVIGPVNGGLPWPQGFRQAKAQNKWVTGLRSLYRYLPFARSTYRCATAIIAGSSNTYEELAAHREKIFFLPENGIDAAICSPDGRCSERGSKLEFIFVGGLIPLKACDIALRAAAPLLREGAARFTVVGDGPERGRLEELATALDIEKEVQFCGWVRHEEAIRRMSSADVLVFPSIRDFGGGVVFEALAIGCVPVVADYGGPGDIVRPDIGYKVRLTNEDDVVVQIKEILCDIAQDREGLNQMRQRGVAYARECLSWDAKAQALTSIMHWALRQGPKPDFPPPRIAGLN